MRRPFAPRSLRVLVPACQHLVGTATLCADAYAWNPGTEALVERLGRTPERAMMLNETLAEGLERSRIARTPDLLEAASAIEDAAVRTADAAILLARARPRSVPERMRMQARVVLLASWRLLDAVEGGRAPDATR